MHEEPVDTQEILLATLIDGQGNADAYEELLKTHKNAAENHVLMQQKHDEFRQTHLAAMAEFKRLTRLFETTELS